MLILRGTLVLSFGLMILSPAPGRAQDANFRNPEQAPPSWAQFAKLVKYRFEEWIAADETVANRFRNWVIEHSGKENGPPPTLRGAGLAQSGRHRRARHVPGAQ